MKDCPSDVDRSVERLIHIYNYLTALFTNMQYMHNTALNIKIASSQREEVILTEIQNLVQRLNIEGGRHVT